MVRNGAGKRMSAGTWFVIFLYVAICFARSAYAETLDAIITSVYDGGSSIEATIKDPYGKMDENVRLSMDPDVQLEGLVSLQDLNVGARVQLEAEKTFDGRWVVKKVAPRSE